MKHLLLISLLVTLTGCFEANTANSREAKAVAMQQSQYEKAQPVPVFDYSLERDRYQTSYEF